MENQSNVQKVNRKCCFNVIEREVVSKMVKWKTDLNYRSLTAVLGKQVNFGLEIKYELHKLFNIFTTFAVRN
jgi:outer membrane receptor for monomeric catechols